jgi:hypothetical protein
MVSLWNLETGKRRWGYYTFGYWSELAVSADGSKGATTVRGGVLVFNIPK